MKRVTIEFDAIPPASLRPNTRGVGYLKETDEGKMVFIKPNRSDYDSWKAQGLVLGREQVNAKGVEPIDGPCVLYIEFRNKRRIDCQGMGYAYKGFIDGLQEAGLITNDGEIWRETVERLPNGAPYSKIVLAQQKEA